MRRKENNFRIYLILADENLFHPRFFLGLVKEFRRCGHKIVGVTVAKDPFRHGFITAVKQQIGLWGVLPFSFIAFNTILRSKLSTIGFLKESTIDTISKKYKIPLVVSDNVNSENHLKLLKKLDPDIVISSNGQIFGDDLLSLPRIACINRHTGLLPLYGGVVPVFWSMVNDEKEFGVSVHYMVKAIDQGDILSQIKIPVDSKNSLFKNYILGFDKSVDATIQAISNISENKIIKKFSKNKKNYYSFPNQKVIQKFNRKYKSFIYSDIFTYYLDYLRKN